MPRLRNKATKVVVNVDDALAATLGAEWESAEEKPKTTPKRQPAKKAPEPTEN